eukprot:8428_1
MALILLLEMSIYISALTSQSQPTCTDISDSSTCDETEQCKYNSESSICQCASESELDILFAVDASGSIGLPHWQIVKSFIAELVENSISDSTRIGFFIFSTNVNESRLIQSWQSKAELTVFIHHLFYETGYTNTPLVLERAIAEFERVSGAADSENEYDRHQLLLIITDGNPTIQGNANISVCPYEQTLKDKGIQVVIVGVGDHITKERMLCLTESEDDFMSVNAFTEQDFHSIAGLLEYKVCPSRTDLIPIEIPKINMITIGGIDIKWFIGAMLLLIICCCCCGCLWWYKRKKRVDSVKQFEKTMKEQNAMFEQNVTVCDSDDAEEEEEEEKTQIIKSKAVREFEETMKQQNEMFS